MFHKTSVASLALIAFVAMAIDARADVVRSATSVVSAPPVLGAFSFDRTIDQSGLTIGYVSGVTDFNTYIGLSPTHLGVSDPTPNFAASPTTVPQNIDYDLGATYPVTKMAFWNYPFNTLGPVTSLDVFTANNAGFAGAFFAGSFLPADDAASDVNQVQVFDLADSNARYVRLRITGQATIEAIGYSEVAFGVVPEPFTVGYIAVAAVTLLSAAGRTRRRSRCQ